MKTTTFFRRLFLAAALAGCLGSPGILRADVGGDNSTGISGVFNGNITTGGSYDPYTGNATRSVTDLEVAGAAGNYPLAFTRTMNSRYTSGAGTLEFGQAATWRHSYQWSIRTLVIVKQSWEGDPWTVMPSTYTVDYPDGRRVGFSASSSDPFFRALTGSGVSDRFEPLADPNGGDCALLLPDGGKVYFQVEVDRFEDEQMHTVTSTFTYQFMGISDPHGLFTSVSFPADGSTTITEPAGRCLKLFYAQTSWFNAGVRDRVLVRLEERAYETAPARRSIAYNYAQYSTGAGSTYTSLASVVYFGDASIVASYTYQNSNVSANGRPLPATCSDPMYAGPMGTIRYEFAPGSVHGLILREKHLNGTMVSALSINGNSRTETRGDGPTRTFNYSGGKLVSYTDFKNQTSYISYDGNGYTSGFTDARGNTTTTLREGTIGALSRLTHPDQSYQGYAYRYVDAAPYFVEIRGDEREKNTYFTRDANNRVSKVWYPDYPNGATEEFTYNDFGQVLTHRMTSGGTEVFTYDGRGLLTTHTPPATPSDPNPGSHPTRLYYDGNDRISQVTDPLGHNTWFQYNLRGQVTRVTHHDNTYIQNAYNPDGTLASATDELGHTTAYSYDDYKRVLSVTNPLNQITTTSYALDWVNPLVHTTKSIKYVNSPMNKNIVFDYDENFRKSDQVAALGTADEAWTLFQYDAVGNLTSTIDPLGHTVTFGYDNRNRRTSSTDELNQITSWEYDPTSNPTKEIRPDQSFRRMEYDSMNRVIDTYGFANEHTHYERDLAGNILQMVDPKQASYGLGYDALNRKISASYPVDATGVSRGESWHYDQAGNLDQYTNPAGQVKTLSYNDRNRLSGFYWSSGSAPSVALQYDGASRLISVVTGETSVAFGYDDANRKIWEDQTLTGYPTRRVQTPHDSDGNRSALEVTGYYVLNYEYNQRNQLLHLRGSNNNPFCDYTYDAGGHVTNRQGWWPYPNGVNFHYDELNRVNQVEQGDASVVFARSYYQYDALNREVATWRDEQNGKGERFWYNATSQLTSVVHNADSVQTGNPSNWSLRREYNYTPDLLNWASVNDNGYLAPFANNALNQYTTINTQVPEYDNRFNFYRLDGFQLDHNASNQLISVTGNSHSAQFTYDGLGRCVRRLIDGNTIVFTYDGWNRILEWDQGGSWRAWTVYGAGPDEILARSDATFGPLIYKQDKRGSVAFLLNGSNQIVEKYTYDAFGNPTVTNGDGTGTRKWSNYGNRFMFTGREYIKELDIYDYRNRFYQPGIGRFLQPDPIGFAGGDANLFRYCGGDPVNFTDPSGLWYGPLPNPQIPLTHAQLQYFGGMTFAGMFGAASLAGQGRWGPPTGFAIGVAAYYLSQPYPASGGFGGPGGISPGGTDIRDFGGSMDITNGQALPQSPSGGSGDGSAGSAGGNGGYNFLYVSVTPGYWSYENYQARHDASMASSNFSSTMAPFWNPGTPNNTGTTGDAGHTIYYPNPYVHGQVVDGVVVPVPGGFGIAARPGQGDLARYGFPAGMVPNINNIDLYNKAR